MPSRNDSEIADSLCDVQTFQIDHDRKNIVNTFWIPESRDPQVRVQQHPTQNNLRSLAWLAHGMDAEDDRRSSAQILVDGRQHREERRLPLIQLIGHFRQEQIILTRTNVATSKAYSTNLSQSTTNILQHFSTKQQ